MLSGKVAIVTGASRGIGRETALTLAGYGATVIVNYCGSKDKAEAVVEEITAAGGTAKAYQGDVSDFDVAKEMIISVKKEFGSIDILVNNAGITKDNLIMKMSEEEFLNFSTKVNVDWTVKPQILKRSKGFTKKAGSIIYINLKIFPHKKVRIGVIKGGKVKKYYEVTTGLEKEIPVKDTDTYSVFVQNMTNSTINAKGSYIK